MSKTHGMRKTRTYRKWASMVERTTNPRCGRWAYYGGRGIALHAPWREFILFYADMGECPEDYTLERKDNSKGYSPDNCIWADRTTQANNRRNNRRLTALGETLTLAQWAERTGLNAGSIRSRIRYGWPPDLIVTVPIRGGVDAQKAKMRIAIQGRTRNKQGRFL